MSGWGGFTEEDLRRMENEASGNNEQRRPRPQGRGGGASRKQANLHAGKNQPRMMKSKLQSPSTQAADLPTEQRLSTPKIKPQTNRTRAQDNEQSCEKPSVPEEKPEKQEAKAEQSVTPTEDNHPEKEPVELEETEVAKRGMSNLQKFQEQQKQMEELNKQKRAMLATAIQQRRKKAVAEASKLNALHKELDRLDDLLTEDVSKIRDRIEIASRDYLDAQKRYERAENEFIAAKMDLHQKEELKESLTEHLYTVIHHNEVRKSKKLAELMGALDIDEAAELAEMVNLPEIPIMIPQASYIPKNLLSPPQNVQQKSDQTVGEESSDTIVKEQKETETSSQETEKQITEQGTTESKSPATKDENTPKDSQTKVKSNGVISAESPTDMCENNNKENVTTEESSVAKAT